MKIVIGGVCQSVEDELKVFDEESKRNLNFELIHLAKAAKLANFQGFVNTEMPQARAFVEVIGDRYQWDASKAAESLIYTASRFRVPSYILLKTTKHRFDSFPDLVKKYLETATKLNASIYPYDSATHSLIHGAAGRFVGNAFGEVLRDARTPQRGRIPRIDGFQRYAL